ncbi:MAG TPA: V-type ATP synthase subunit D [Syntrophorhabdus sp.]|jgi:V/A-type H+-transporting ATPase subunit D|nr:V-type ATP synthase subunit D [Syntrophorhabdus sp.]MDI9557352.1 V-type ATP synthase subunit D [Pseudomonadota bacterium]OPX97413.1 MAG: V-type ATP synthase subunit D [Syntrophorhabdus sp. PtaB.Bin027]OQB76204.1 MAG: V-type ATP synthase subunit D [Deltaproteobacteria bacterium ADurb.Bin135]MBP8745776.1 V-type ATP synthase subunit D [Syntrophorhabdus sp.]
MAERIRLNKVSLREQKQKMAMYERFLPALEARKQQLIMQLAVIRTNILVQRELMETMLADIRSWASLYWDVGKILRYYIAIREIRCVSRNVAGLKIREFKEVIFDDPGYSLFRTPFSFDTILKKTRDAISLREGIKILEEQEQVLLEGFRKTSQRINLYEKRLIPQCREAIRRISVYLQDQQAAAVGVAKVAKRLGEEASYYVD